MYGQYDALRLMRGEGFNKPTIFMPWTGEYGVMLMYWIRFIHHTKAPHKIVCCKRGDEPYFPSADVYEYDWTDPVPDAERRGTGWHLAARRPMRRLRKQFLAKYPDHQPIDAFRMPQRPWSIKFADYRFTLEPRERYGLKADIVLGCRNRQHGLDRNWQYWPQVADAIKLAGYSIGLVGNRDTSIDLPQASVRAWDYGDNNANANIELLRNCRLYVGTDTGTTHLASLCNIPMVIFRDPGPWECLSMVQQTTRGHCGYIDAWADPGLVIQSVLTFMRS